MNLVPVTGQPLPLVSMGGTSMWFTCLPRSSSALAAVYMTNLPWSRLPTVPRKPAIMPQQPLKVSISGGGTGGHIFPAIAIANAVKDKAPDTRFLFVGAEGKMEMEKVPAAGYEIAGLPIRGFQRKALWKNVGLPWRDPEHVEGAPHCTHLSAACGRGRGRLRQRTCAGRGPTRQGTHAHTGTEQPCRCHQPHAGEAGQYHLCRIPGYGPLFPSGKIALPATRSGRTWSA